MKGTCSEIKAIPMMKIEQIIKAMEFEQTNGDKF